MTVGRARSGARRPRGSLGPKLPVHVENDPESPVDAITPERFQAAARRVPALARRITVTFGAAFASRGGPLHSAEVLIASPVPPLDLATRAPHLRWIQSTSAGVEAVVPLVPSGVTLTNASGVHGPKAAEYALTALLMLNHRVPHFVTRQRQARWDPAYSTVMAGKSVAVIGVGQIGAAVARLALRFGLRVVGVRRSGRPAPGVERMYRPEQLPRILPHVDFVVVTTPLTAETRGLLGRRELDLLPRHAGLVNLGRGSIVDHDALREKLERHELAGAVLDAFPEEPLPAASPLWSTPNLLISPHCAIADEAVYAQRCLDIFFDNLGRYLAGRPLRNRVDLSRGY